MPHVWRMFQNGRAKYRTRVLYTKSNPTTAYLDVQCKIECSDLLFLKIRATVSGSSAKKSNLKGCRLKPSSNIFHSDLGNICVVQLVQNCPLKTILWMKTKRRCTAANFFLLLWPEWQCPLWVRDLKKSYMIEERYSFFEIPCIVCWLYGPESQLNDAHRTIVDYESCAPFKLYATEVHRV